MSYNKNCKLFIVNNMHIFLKQYYYATYRSIKSILILIIIKWYL